MWCYCCDAGSGTYGDRVLSRCSFIQPLRPLSHRSNAGVTSSQLVLLPLTRPLSAHPLALRAPAGEAPLRPLRCHHHQGLGYEEAATSFHPMSRVVTNPDPDPFAMPITALAGGGGGVAPSSGRRHGYPVTSPASDRSHVEWTSGATSTLHSRLASATEDLPAMDVEVGPVTPKQGGSSPSSPPRGTRQRTVPHCTALQCTARTAYHWTGTALHCTAYHCTAYHCTALHYTALHITVLRCSALYSTVPHRCTGVNR